MQHMLSICMSKNSWNAQQCCVSHAAEEPYQTTCKHDAAILMLRGSFTAGHRLTFRLVPHVTMSSYYCDCSGCR